MSDAWLRLNDTLELLDPAAMAMADRLTIDGGTSGLELMERAGLAVAGRVRDRWDGGRIMVLCGPGNNGGDGFVAARRLREWGFAVDVRLLGARAKLKGDAAAAAAAWPDTVAALGEPDLAGVGLVIDALFGAGLGRDVPAEVARWADTCATAGIEVVAVDLPSGVAGGSGAVLGAAFQAVETVTFGRAKPGHLLLPGGARCGRLTIADIGLDPAALARAHAEGQEPVWRNRPALWTEAFAPPAPGDHKYKHGHATVVAGDAAHGGAGRLAARAALARGAGLVTTLVPAPALAVHASRLEAVMVRPLEDDELSPWLADPRRNAWLLGPGGGAGPALRAQVEAVLDAGRATVLDADALTSFAGDVDGLARHVRAPTVLTPHAGEAARLVELTGDRLADARHLAETAGAVVVLKGFDSVVAAPDGRAAIAENGCPALATAGTGDVLAGIVLAHLSRGADPFAAACAAVWLHNEAAWIDPRGLTAERLLGQLAATVTRTEAIAA